MKQGLALWGYAFHEAKPRAKGQFQFISTSDVFETSDVRMMYLNNTNSRLFYFFLLRLPGCLGAVSVYLDIGCF